MTSLQGVLVGISVIGIGIILRKKQVWRLLPSMLVYAAAFYKNVSAPGNSVRGAVFKEWGVSTDAVTAITRSFLEAFRYMKTFTGQMTLAVMILLAPVILRIVKNSKCQFRYPGMVLLYSFCLYATGFTSSLYVMGGVPVARILNAVKITYQILVIINEVYWLGWICRKLENTNEIYLLGWTWQKLEKRAADQSNTDLDAMTKKSLGSLRASRGTPIVFYVAAGLLMLGFFAADPRKEDNYSSWTAYHYVHTGEADAFHKQYLERVETIKNGGDVVIVEPYVFRPWILVTADLSEDVNSGPNRSIAQWYRKQAVICSFQVQETQ